MAEDSRIKRAINWLKSQGYFSSQKEIGEKLGITNRSYLSQLVNADIPNEDFVNKFTDIAPQISAVWLLTGEGEMLEDNSGNEEVEVYEEVRSANVIPLLPVEAIAGGLQYWSSRVELADCRKVVSPIPGADYAIQVSGDSMEPEIHNGTYVYIKKINERSFIPWGNTMVVDTENGVVVKKLFPIENDSNTILAKSVNPAYPPFKIPTESIFGIYRVLGGSFVVSTI